MRVSVDIEEIQLQGDYSLVDGLCLRCSRCDHEVEVYGTSDASIRAGCAMLRDECPEDENNFYAAEESDS